MPAKSELEALRARCEELERDCRAKTEFIASMSHEIRGSLGCLQSFSELLLEDDRDDARRRRYLDAIRRNADRVLRIVNDSLDLSRAEACSGPIRMESFSLSALLQEVVESFEVKSGRKGLKIGLRVESSLPVSFVSDDGLIRQILVNLVGNAVKFTDSGAVEIVAERVEKSGRPFLRVSVEDTGPGVPDDEREFLFEPYRQGRIALEGGVKGTGLGLSIARRLAGLLDGDLQLRESRPGRGSIFSLFLPLEGAVPSSASFPRT